MKIQNLILTALITTFITACSSTKVEEVPKPSSNIPSWVLNPVIKDGLASADCVKFSGHMSIDKKMATANSRLALAQQIDIRVKGLDKTYSNRVDSNDETTGGTTFSSVSKQLTNQTLNGSRVEKVDLVKILDKDHLCVLTTLNPSATSELFKNIINKSQRSINPKDEKFLYQEFKAQQAEKSLNEAINKLTQG